MRDQTEWVELTEAGCSILSGANSDTIIQSVQTCLSQTFHNGSIFYGNGHAAEIICNHLAAF